jgi:YD repeat-containing protein
MALRTMVVRLRGASGAASRVLCLALCLGAEVSCSDSEATAGSAATTATTTDSGPSAPSTAPDDKRGGSGGHGPRPTMTPSPGSAEPGSGAGGNTQAPSNAAGDASSGGTPVSEPSSSNTAGEAGTASVPTAAGGASGASVGMTEMGGASASGGVAGSGGATEPDAATWPLVNGVQWADTEGNPIQAHGGGVLKVGSDYYWFGENRNPDGTFYAVSAYRSRNLVRWEHVHDVLTMNSDPDLKPANIERPKVVYNAQTQQYVMWMHWENGRDYGEARAAVASSDTVAGNYTYQGSFRPLQDSGVMDHDKPGYMSRDCTLFVDDNGKGYFISSSNENYDLHLYLLSDDYLSIENRAALLFEGGHREAPALFKRGDTYFLLTSAATGWDPNQAQYATSSSLTSGWSNLKNVGDGTTFHSQSTFVLPVEGSDGTSYLYLGDRWAGAWGGRVNDSSYVWQPIDFPMDTSMSMTFANDLHLDATSGSVSGTVDAFTLLNENSGLTLAVDGPTNQNSSNLVQDDPTTAGGTAWRFEYDGAGYFAITNDDGGKVVDVPDESTDPNVALKLYDGNGGDHQAWRPIDLGEGKYRFRNKNSGLYLGVADGSTEALASVQQQTGTDGPEQIWELHVAE